MKDGHFDGGVVQRQRGRPRHEVGRAGQVVGIDLPAEHVVGAIPLVVRVSNGHSAADQGPDQQVRLLVGDDLEKIVWTL